MNRIPRPFGARNEFTPWDCRRPTQFRGYHCRGKGCRGNMACACDSVSPCLSRKRQSWEHGVCLRFPFPPSCRGNDNHGNTPCACETLFPLPDKEKAVVGCLRFAFPFACRRKGLPRDSAGLRGWGAHGALQGSVAGVRTELRRALKGSAGLCKASWLGIAFPSTGRGKWPSQARSGVSSISRLREAPFPRQAEGKGAGAPQGQHPPPGASVLSMSRPRNAFFLRENSICSVVGR